MIFLEIMGISLPMTGMEKLTQFLMLFVKRTLLIRCLRTSRKKAFDGIEYCSLYAVTPSKRTWIENVYRYVFLSCFFFSFSFIWTSESGLCRFFIMPTTYNKVLESARYISEVKRTKQLYLCHRPQDPHCRHEAFMAGEHGRL
ncbi:hypothetical protein BDF20DRAFT_836296 [Mycotypha africana]|uniref:uncharacterized protein n=1 Tax=Mycotypha africana TaxID=64632 RepID=UPI002300F44B|nr:uncharacterized protein BDF20DRAFT_836296 [Mycotypha africana]KAI8977505.1 hypothetical protein BDF20DRAFT_836296 [Mycotypha africana]